MSVELLGTVGLVLLVSYGITQYLCLGPSVYNEIGQGAIILIATGYLCNSLLLDHAEGLFFAWIMCVALACSRNNSQAETC